MRKMAYVPVSQRKGYSISLDQMYKEIEETTQTLILKNKCLQPKPKVKKRKRG